MNVAEHDKRDVSGKGWKFLLRVLRQSESISYPELASLVRKYTSLTPRHAVRRLQKEKLLRRPEFPKRGLYVYALNRDSAHLINPVEAVVNALGPKTVFAYGTALYLHGLSRYERINEYFVLASSRANLISVGAVVVRPVKSRLAPDMGVESLTYGRIKVRVTDLERTLVECIHRPKYAQGWENVVEAFERSRKVNGRRMIDYVKQYGIPSLASKVGWIVEQHANAWGVTSEDLQTLHPYLPRTPVKIARRMGGQRNRRWNLYIPGGNNG